MSTTWQFEQRDGYACMVSTGVATQHTCDTSNLTMLVRDLQHHARETGYTRYLLDRRQVDFGPATLQADIAVHHTGSLVEELRLGALIHRCAILVTPQRLPDTSFQEDVYNNRGITLRYFADEDHAVTWLTAS